MDLSQIKNKLAELSSDNTEREKVDYEKVFWRPTTGKHQIRIVPSIYDPTFPFTELKFHYGIGQYPMIALSNFGKQDPVEEFVKELKKTSDRDNWSLAGKLTPKSRFFAPVVVRGEEDKGVRLWGFGKTIFKALLSLAEDEDIGDYTDVVNGFDMIVEQVQGNPYPETTVRIKPKMTPLSDNNNLVDSWLKTQPNPLEVYTEYDYEFIKKQLQNYISPGESEASEIASTTSTSTVASVADDGSLELGDLPGMPATKRFTLEDNTEHKSTVTRFDDIFND